MTQLDGRLSARPSRSVAEVRGLTAAVTLLTRIPLRGGAAQEADSLALAGPAFPLVGAGIGAATGGVVAGLAGPLTPALAAALALAVAVLLTGALHLDGLADSADALGADSRQRALAVMRDHHIGAYGALAIALDLLIKAAALTALAKYGDAPRFAVVAGALSRSTAIVLATALPYARSEPGVAAQLTRGGYRRAIVAVCLAAVIAVALAGADGAVAAGAAAALAAGLYLSLRRWLGGVTGDALGASVELCELTVLVAAVALRGAG